MQNWRNIALVVSYDGTDYYGFQSQPDGNTIQDKLKEALYLITGEQIRVIGSGRTDAGVHAHGQVVNFRIASQIPIDRWALALNARLPDDIRIRSAHEVPIDFHASHDSVSKTYRYSIISSRFQNVFNRRYALHHPTPLDFEAMKDGLQYLIGEHDFTSFTSPQSTKRSHVRTILDARLEVEAYYPLEFGDDNRYPGKQRGLIHLYLTGSGFLYNMVRIVAATIIQVGERKIQPKRIADIVLGRNRSLAAPTALPHGLTLWQLQYEFPLGKPLEAISNPWRQQ
jgi:tRNA pseudouridine38-40 synthase